MASAIYELLVANFLPISALLGAAANGTDDALKGNELRKGICDSNETIKTLTNTFSKLQQKEVKDKDELQQTFAEHLLKIKQHTDDIKIARKEFIVSRNTMIISAILFIISIIISLAFKVFGVFDLVYASLFGKK